MATKEQEKYLEVLAALKRAREVLLANSARTAEEIKLADAVRRDNVVAFSPDARAEADKVAVREGQLHIQGRKTPEELRKELLDFWSAHESRLASEALRTTEALRTNAASLAEAERLLAEIVSLDKLAVPVLTSPAERLRIAQLQSPQNRDSRSQK